VLERQLSHRGKRQAMGAETKKERDVLAHTREVATRRIVYQSIRPIPPRIKKGL